MIKNVVLIGFMGTGKSSCGRVLASQLGFRFVDLDKAIEQKWDMTIPEMFEKYGESFFWEKEKEMCREIAAKRSVVIATGGGTVKDPDNVRALRSTGKIICLTASVDTVLERTMKHGERPLLDAYEDRRQGIEELMKARKEMYAQADYCVDTSQLSPMQVAKDIANYMKKA